LYIFDDLSKIKFSSTNQPILRMDLKFIQFEREKVYVNLIEFIKEEIEIIFTNFHAELVKQHLNGKIKLPPEIFFYFNEYSIRENLDFLLSKFESEFSSSIEYLINLKKNVNDMNNGGKIDVPVFIYIPIKKFEFLIKNKNENNNEIIINTLTLFFSNCIRLNKMKTNKYYI
jgi:hypothetical protein